MAPFDQTRAAIIGRESEAIASRPGVAAASVPFKLGYVPALDGMRAISILVVMFHHGDLFWMGRGGFLGVDIFFVLSGFLITSLLLQEWEKTADISLRKFYGRRALRLLPALFALIIIALIWYVLAPPPEGLSAAVKSVLVVVFYSSNWIPALWPLGHTWSLSIEEQFYIIWPSVLFLMLRLRWKRRTILLTASGLVLLIAAHRFHLYFSQFRFAEGLHFRVYAGSDTRGDALLIGCVAGMLVTWQLIPRLSQLRQALKAIAIVASLFLAGMIFRIGIWDPSLYYGLLTLVALAAACVLVYVIQHPDSRAKRFLEQRPLVWIGRLSYSLYLWHPFAYRVCAELMPTIKFRSYTLTIMTTLLIEMLGAFVVASLSYYFVEQPFLRVKKRIRVVED